MAKKKPRDSGYVGDKLLATYQALTSCCGLSLVSTLALVSLGLAAKPSVVRRFEKDYPSEIWRFLSDPKYTLPVGILLVFSAVLDVCWIVATWRGRRGALRLHLISSGSGSVLGLILGRPSAGLIFPLVVTVYCFLRLSGYVGPTEKKRRKR